MAMVDALILAGSPNDGQLKDCSPARYEALINIGGKAMVEYVVDALKESPDIRRIVVVGPPEELKKVLPGYTTVVPANLDLMGNLLEGLKYLPDAGQVLMATCDIPMITPQAIENFLFLCSSRKADIYYPVIPRSYVERSYPRTRRTYVSFREGQFTGGNLFLFNPAVVEGCLRQSQRVIDARKSPLRLGRMLGLNFLLKFLLHRITLKEAEARASGLLGVNGAVVISNYPEMGVDVDKPSDLELAIDKLSVAI
jgi:GTP:adenosylcobinamide-phosphate guanylyltransferase